MVPATIVGSLSQCSALERTLKTDSPCPMKGRAWERKHHTEGICHREG